MIVASPMAAEPTVDATSAMDLLIERCLGGDQVAWEQIVRQHWRKVFNLAYKFVGRHDEAEDLTQDIFLKIFKALKTFDRRANFQTWLISISRNLCIDHYRSVRKERETMARDVDASVLVPVSRERGPYAELEQVDLKHLIRLALAELPPTLRQASECPNSWVRTMRKSARYSSTFQVREEYAFGRSLISYTATRNYDQ